MNETEAWAAHLPPHETTEPRSSKETAPMDKIDTSTDAVKKLLDGVTPGDWQYHPSKYDNLLGVEFASVKHPGGSVFETGCWSCTSVEMSDADGRIIAASRALVPALLAERDAAHDDITRLTASNAELATENERLRAKLDAAVEALERIGGLPYETLLWRHTARATIAKIKGAYHE